MNITTMPMENKQIKEQLNDWLNRYNEYDVPEPIYTPLIYENDTVEITDELRKYFA